MKLDEAIVHAREIAKRNREQWKNCPADRRDIEHQTCEQCAEEYEQLATWLKNAYKSGYNKAIDDLITKCKNAKFAESDEISLSDIHTGVNSGLSMAIHFAEQLKAGITND